MSDGEDPSASSPPYRESVAPISKPASIRDVARRAGVSITTVSHALSGKRHVAPATVARIRAVVPELGYVPYFAARTLQSGRSFVIGLVVPDISNQFFAAVAQGVEEYAHSQDYAVSLWTSKADAQRERRYFNVLRSGAIDGLLYNAAGTRADKELLTIAQQFPMVAVDEPLTELSSVPHATADHRAGGRLAADYLAALGHRRTAVLTGPDELVSSHERVAGFREVFPDAVTLTGGYSESSGAALTATLLAAHPDITAVFAGNDLMAYGTISECRRQGVRVPEDMSVIGFDDIDFAARMSPSLTTIRQPANDIGRLAATMLLEHITAGKMDQAAQHAKLPVELIERASCSAPAVRNPTQGNT